MAVESQPLEDVLNHPMTKGLPMPNTVKAPETDIVVQQYKPDVDRGQQPGVAVSSEQQNVAERNLQVVLTNRTQEGPFKTRTN